MFNDQLCSFGCIAKKYIPAKEASQLASQPVKVQVKSNRNYSEPPY